MEFNAIMKTEIATREAVSYFLGNWGLMPNPDMVLRKQGKTVADYHELLYDPHVFSCVTSRKSGTLSMEWLLQADEGDKIAKKLKEILANINIQDVIGSVLDAPLYGYQVMEVIWDEIDGMALPVAVIGKPPEYFAFDAFGKLVLNTRYGYNSEIPAYKFILARNGATYANPYGEAVFARCYWAAFFKKNGQRFWNHYIDKYGSPYIVATHEFGSDTAKVDEFTEMLSQLAQEGVLAIPHGTDVRIETDGSTARSDIYKEFLHFCNSEISKAILGQTLTTEIQDGGSYAAAKSHLDVRADIIESDKRLVEQTINTLIRWIYELNMIQTPRPKFKFYEESDAKIGLAQRDEILSRMGVKFSKTYHVKQYGFDEEDIEVAVALPQQQPATFADETLKSDVAQIAIETMVTGISDAEIQFQTQKILKPIISLIRDSVGFADVLDGLAGKYPEMDTKKLETMMLNRILLAETVGMASAEYVE